MVAIPTFSHRIRTEQPAEQQLQAAASALYYMPYMTPELLIKSFARYNEIIREVARAAGAVLIEGEMQIPGDDTHFNDAVHFRDEGNRAMATRAANGLLASPEFEALPYSNPRALAAGA